MTLQEYDNLPMGTTLYFVYIDKKSNKARIGYLPKSDYKNANKFCVRLSTTKQGAIENAVELYKQQIAHYTQAYKAVTELKKIIMKPKELQLNDLVRVADQVVKVTALGESTINGQPATMFNPIMLTEEIMEANGFEYNCYVSYGEVLNFDFPGNNELNSKGFGVELHKENDEDIVFMITDHSLMQFKYVHELQHALRLCGLNEMADNFKVE